MKYIIITMIAFFIGNGAASQNISNTTWKGTILMPDAVDVKFIFKKDTLRITSQFMPEIGTIFFSQNGDSLTIRKISGPSPCPEQAQGIYRIEWLQNGNSFRLHAISDECEGRIGVFTLNPFERISNN
jgi:hypothetical protein